MFRLPVCPHCGTVYRYRDTKKAWKQKENTCYHCKKTFRAKLMPYGAAEALLLLPLCIGFNILMLNRMRDLNLFALFAATVAFILLFYLLIPFFIHFVKKEENPEKSVKTTKKTSDPHKTKSNSLKNQQKQHQSNKKRRS